MTFANLKHYSKQIVPAVEAEMRTVFSPNTNSPAPFHGMMHYHMGWVDADFTPAVHNGGKRIRPLLCALVCAAAGGDWRQAVPAGAAIEILHNFTLVHDDIQDASPRRRGRQTVWTIWGKAQAINTGDAMFALAHLAMGRLAQRDVPAPAILTALRRLDETCVDLTIGQYLDMSFETRDEVAVAEYVTMIRGKTAVLLSLCAELGALIAGCDESTQAHYAQLGLELGLAFQVRDDILGIWGDEAVIGKSAATDIVTRKKSLPVLFGLAQSRELRTLYDSGSDDPDFVAKAVQLLDEAGARADAEARAAAHSQRALAHWEEAGPAGEAAVALRELTDMLLQRNA